MDPNGNGLEEFPQRGSGYASLPVSLAYVLQLLLYRFKTSLLRILSRHRSAETQCWMYVRGTYVTFRNAPDRPWHIRLALKRALCIVVSTEHYLSIF